MHSLSEILFEKLKSYGELTAIKCEEKTISYAELSSKALSIASLLVERGARSEAVGIIGQRTLDSYFGILGAVYAGCYWVPINTKYTADRLITIIKSANIRYLICDKKAVELILPILKSSNLANIELIIVPEGDGGIDKGYVGREQLENVVSITHPISCKYNDIAYIMFTSGTTGVPKGVKVTQANVVEWLANMNRYYKFNPGFIASQTYDLSFDLSVADIIFTWANGGILNVLGANEYLMPFDYIIREKIQLWSSVPTLISFMHKMGLLEPNIFPDITLSLFCGEPLPHYLADAWQIAAPNSKIENLYGPTEATIWLTRYIYGEEQRSSSFTNSILPIGLPFPDHIVEVINENGELLPPGQIGELVYKGPQISDGYLNNPGATEAVFLSFIWDSTGSIWYKSGDLGFLNSGGVFECIGRKDGQFKIGGRRVEVGEIESVLRRYPQTQDAVVVPITNDLGVVTNIVAITTSEINKEQEFNIRKDSEKYLERIFFPKMILTIDAFPLTNSGKIDRRALAIFAKNR